MPELFPAVPLEAWDDYRGDFPETFAGNHIRLEIGCYVVRSQGQTILVDTGYGPGPIEGELGQLMDNLSANGVEAGDVDVVFFSHLHPDHTGWNTVWGEEEIPTESDLPQRAVRRPHARP